jgi:hypothetical protein
MIIYLILKFGDIYIYIYIYDKLPQVQYNKKGDELEVISIYR